MSRTLRVTVPHSPAALHDALLAAGLPVVTIRSDWANLKTDPVCLWSVIVFDPSVDLTAKAAQIQSVITAHLNSPSVSGKVPSATTADMNSSLAKLELM